MSIFESFSLKLTRVKLKGPNKSIQIKVLPLIPILQAKPPGGNNSKLLTSSIMDRGPSKAGLENNY